MIEIVSRKNKITKDDVNTLITLKSGQMSRTVEPIDIGDGELILYTHKGQAVLAKTPGQNRFTNHQPNMISYLPLVRQEREKLIHP